MTDLPLNGQDYRIGNLPALQQFHVTRRLMPALAAVGLSVSSLKAAATGKDDGGMLDAIEKASDVLAKMSDEDANYVLFTCLAVVTRKSGTGYAKISQGTALAFDDIDMLVMLRLVVEVVKQNMAGFFRVLGDDTNSSST